MLKKDLLRVSRRGGGFHPEFAGADAAALAGRVLGVFQGHVGEPRSVLEDALADLEREAPDFKLVRGLADLVERTATFETRAAVEPRRAREVAFRAAEREGVVTPAEREAALADAADRLDASPGDVADALHADREARQVLTAVGDRYDPERLLAQYNLSLAQTALFDALEVRLSSTDPKALVGAVKRHGLMYEVVRGEGGVAGGSTGTGDADPTRGADDWTVVVTGPDALFRRSRRYGIRFARLLRTVAGSGEWHLSATVDDRGTERTLELSDADPVTVPDAAPVAEVTYDSGVEAEFAARFSAVDLDWTLVREPAPFAAGDRVMIPDFAIEYDHADFRVFFEIMGFWTPDYVEKKLAQLAAVDDVEMLVAVDEDLGVGEEIAARDHRAIGYSGSVRLKDVRAVLREFEADLVAVAAADLPDELVPEADVVTLADLAAEWGVSEAAIEDVAVPEHERVGRTLVRPAVLEELGGVIEVGMAYDDVESVLEGYGFSDASAVLSRLGYRVAWEGLGGGELVRDDGGEGQRQ